MIDFSKYADTMKSLATFITSHGLEWTPETADESMEKRIEHEITCYEKVDVTKLAEELKKVL